ncbi:vitamin K-dependent gamma-carboxylase-like protein [Arcicella aurantiaca]|uniref:Vitamin K-dependent gamma-carboxylase-like protein n=1 Tax=Arcicella aurantiaca TaxID=591202 RepID=A0A316EAY0_9BACT|nr:HTTM domain-containing protein [Arcicella aurantiaca]PWK20080.1 vitamin K-dependent gamma-carboxylase-like protein [Arcicella aurantiaca]
MTEIKWLSALGFRMSAFANIGSSLAFFRITFGLLMFVAELRFILKGWITDFYVKPQFFFTFYGFGWIHPLPEPYIEWVFYGLVFLSILITLGLFYRFAIVAFFLLFTYVELLDKSVYLNHYYQVSLLAFLMCFLPMNHVYSLDNLFKNKLSFLLSNTYTQSWMLWALRVQVGMVYFFGGVAKLRYDWLFTAQPLRIWLSANEHLPIVGHLLTEKWVAFTLSWLAMMFDLSAPFLLSFRKTRLPIYIVVVIFHLLTHYLFYIGMFPWMMIFTALIFFPADLHERVLRVLSGSTSRKLNPQRRCFGKLSKTSSGKNCQTNFNVGRFFNPISIKLLYFLGLFILIQCLIPFRSYFYGGNVLWHEQGFRFSWNIMLMEKNASLEYHIKIKKTGEEFSVNPNDFLTKIQARQMSFQPDMILQFAHYLHQYYLENGIGDTEIRVECYASLNGRGSQLLINPNIDLVKEKEGFQPKTWVNELK